MLRVLTYHRVAPIPGPPQWDPRIISATPEVFAKQMGYLRRTWSVVSMEQVLEAAEGGRRLPRRAVLVTFDDGYVDLLEHAVPVLTALRLPATIFVPTDFPGRPQRTFWCDRLFRAFTRTERPRLTLEPIGTLSLMDPEQRRMGLRYLQGRLKSMPHETAARLVERVCRELGAPDAPEPSVLDWDRLRELARRGITIGAHSRTHAILTRLPAELAREEIAGSLEAVHRELGSSLDVFCYPNGGHDDTVVELAAEEGVRLAFTTEDGHNDLPGADRLRLRRTNITPRTSVGLLHLRLTRLGAMVDRWRHGAGAVRLREA